MFFETISSLKQTRAEEVLVTGISRLNKAVPMIGPPEMIFFGSTLKPPQASIKV